VKIWLTILIIFIGLQSKADLTGTYGFGSTTAALAGANRARSYDGFTMEKNPALMSESGSRTSYGLLGSQSYFDGISNVVVDNTYIGGKRTVGSVDTKISDTFNFLFGSVWAIGKSTHNYRLGAAFSIPVDKFAEGTTKDTYEPQYAMYMSDSQRVTLSVGGSATLVPSLNLGLGAVYYMQQGATLISRMPLDGGAGNPHTSTINFKDTAKPSLAAIVGMAWDIDENDTVALNYVGVRDQKLTTYADNQIGFINSGNVPLDLTTTASIFYDPEVWSLGYVRQLGATDLNFAVECERWSKFSGANAHISFITLTPQLTQYPEDTSYHDIWVPRIGISTPGFGGTVRAGYAYRPSPTPALNGQTNFVDSDRHILAMGYGFPSKLFGMLEDAVQIETHVQGQYLVPKDVLKDDPNSIGAPGYKVRGFVVSYGLNINVGI